MSTTPRVWFITGSSSGFGRETVLQALARGDNVVATLRNPDALASLTATYPPSRLRVVALDVTKPKQIKQAFQAAKAAFGRIDVVFNNAGYVIVGEAEAVSEDTARALFEVNFWGAVRVSLEAVRFFREENDGVSRKGGLLVQNSATVGLIGYPALSFYAASKFALEGFSESLAKELDPAWNIKVVFVEPGAFKTSVLEKNMIVAPLHPAYTNPALPGSQVRGAFLAGAGHQEQQQPQEGEAGTQTRLTIKDATKAVAKIIEMTDLASPPLHFPLGEDVLAAAREKIRSLSAEIEAYASWSENLAN
ncbi:NAD-P-binding protein [Cubamyces lactineus]|nr:NAD-P-binding protein [Cubamyces lactineus]